MTEGRRKAIAKVVGLGLSLLLILYSSITHDNTSNENYTVSLINTRNSLSLVRHLNYSNLRGIKNYIHKHTDTLQFEDAVDLNVIIKVDTEDNIEDVQKSVEEIIDAEIARLNTQLNYNKYELKDVKVNTSVLQSINNKTYINTEIEINKSDIKDTTVEELALYIKSEVEDRKTVINYIIPDSTVDVELGQKTTDSYVEAYNSLSDKLKISGNGLDYIYYFSPATSINVRSTFDNDIVITENLMHLITKEQQDFIDSKITEFITENNIHQLSDLDKIVKIHDWIIDNTVYSKGEIGGYTDPTSIINTPYSALAFGETKCLGFSGLFQRTLEKAGINCLIVVGEVTEGGHAWNIVELDGVWYYCDITGDDNTKEDGMSGYEFFLFGSNSKLNDEYILDDAYCTEEFSNMYNISKNDYGYNK